MPRLSLSAKLYTIFSLLAAATLALALVAVVQSRRNAAMVADFERAFMGAQNVERVNGLIYAVVMESQGVYMSADIASAKRYGDLLLKFNDRIAALVKDWRRAVLPEDVAQFEQFEQRIRQFIEFRRELVRRGVEIGPGAGREWGDNEANRSVRTALNKDLDALAQGYDQRSRSLYADLERSINMSAWIMSALGLASLMLIAVGAALIWRAVARPLAQITTVTEQVASGAAAISIPHTALARGGPDRRRGAQFPVCLARRAARPAQG